MKAEKKRKKKKEYIMNHEKEQLVSRCETYTEFHVAGITSVPRNRCEPPQSLEVTKE